MNNTLNINNLEFKYRDELILKNINLDINNGLIALLGPNGAGKTTLIKILSTIYKSDKGKINLNNISYKDNYLIKSKIGYLPQKFDIYGHITGRDYLEYVLNVRGINKENINKKLYDVSEKLGLLNIIDKKIKTYSGGMKRRLGIAQAIVGDVDLVILDEPTVGLDPEQRSYFRQILSEISKDKIVLVSTHIVEDIEYDCDQLIVIKDGGIKYSGKVKDFINETKGCIYECEIDIENYQYLFKDVKIIDKKSTHDGLRLKYISSLPLTKNSKLIKSNLNDAYLYLLMENRNG